MVITVLEWRCQVNELIECDEWVDWGFVFDISIGLRESGLLHHMMHHMALTVVADVPRGTWDCTIQELQHGVADEILGPLDVYDHQLRAENAWVMNAQQREHLAVKLHNPQFYISKRNLSLYIRYRQEVNYGVFTEIVVGVVIEYVRCGMSQL